MRAVGVDAVVERVRSMLSCDGRSIVGLVGPPGAGKSTLAIALVEAIGHGVVVPMDGFHLRHAELERLDLVGRKGAPETFDAAGFVELLARLRRRGPAEQVLAPAYSRQIHDVVDDAIVVPADEPLVVVEGNYLLWDVPPWKEVRPLLDLAVYLDADPARRHRSLVERHIDGGRSPSAARTFVDRSDEANARLVEATRGRADLTISIG